MAGNVDNRVVQLQFENRQFEKNIAKSTKSIEELKEAMDFEETSRGLDKFSQMTEKMSFGTLETNLQRLADKFTGIGNAGEYMVSRIRASVESAARSVEYFIRSLSTGQINVGQDKYDQLNKAVMSIISGGEVSEDRAYSVMERVSTYTDQTSHSFQTMVSQIAALTSTGMGLEEAELLIEGIGNAATYAGKGASEAAMSMSVLSKVMTPSSFLGYERFLQLSQTYGVIDKKWRENALAAAEAVGTLKKKSDKLYVNVKGQKAVEVTAENLQDTLKYRWLTGAALQELYKQYQFATSGDWEQDKDFLEHPDKAVDSFGKTAYLTGQRALTLADAINAIKDSVSSGWMDTFHVLFGDVSEAAQHFTNIADRIIEIVDAIKEFRNNVLGGAFGTEGQRTGLFKLLLGDYEEDVETGAVGLLDLIEGAGSMIFDGFKDFMMLFARDLDKEAVEADPAYFSTYLGYMISDAIKNIQEFFGRIRDFFNEEVDVNGKTKSRLEIFHEIIMGIVGALKIAYDIIAGLGDGFWQIVLQLMPSFDSIIGLFSELGLSIYDTADEASKGNKIRKFFTDLATTLKPVTDGINDVVVAITNLLRLILGLDEEGKKAGKDTGEVFGVFGTALKTIADIIGKIAGPVLTFLASIINLITELFKGGITKEKAKEFGTKLGEAFKTMMKSFSDNLPESFGFLKNWINDLFGLWEDESEGDSKSFFTFLRKLFTGGFSSFSEVLAQLTQGFSLKRALETGFGFGEAFNYLNMVTGWFKGTNLYNVIMAFLGVATLGAIFALVMKLIRVGKVIGIFFEDVGGNIKKFGTGFKQGLLDDYEWFGERMLNIAKAIGILAAVVFVFGSMDTGRMIQGIGGLIAVMAAIFGFFWLMTNKIKASYTQQAIIEAVILTMAGTFAAIAVSLSILSLALVPLSSDPKKMITAVLGLAAMLTVFGLFFKIMTQWMDTWTFTSGGTKQWSGIGKMAAVMFTIAGVMGIIALSLGTLVVAIAPLAALGWESMFRAILTVGAMLTMLGAFIVIMLKALDNFVFGLGGGRGWSGMGKMAVMLLTLSASVGLLAVGIGALVVAITPLALMSTEGLIRAVIGLSVILFELGIFMKYLQGLTTNDKKASLKIAGFAAFAASLGILIFALTPLALMPWEAWTRAMVGLGIVLLELGLMIEYITNLSSNDKTATLKIAGFAAFAASLGILIFALTPLAAMTDEGFIKAIGGLALVLLEIIGFMKLATVAKVDGVALGGFIGFAASIAILIFSLKPLAEMTPEGYVRAMIGLATVLLEMVVLMAIIKEMKPDLGEAGSAMLMLIALGASMILFGIAFNEVKDVPWQTIISFAGGIALILAALGLGAKLANGVGIKGMLIMAVGLAAILGVIALMAPLLIGSVMGALREAAGDLAIIADLMSTVSSKTSAVDEGGFDKASRLIDKIAEIVTKLSAFIFRSGSTQTFMTCMADLVLAAAEMEKFDRKMKDISVDGGAGKALGIIVQYESLFTEHLSGFGTYISYAQSFYDAMFKLGSGFDYFNNMTKDMGSAEDNNGLQMIKQLAACAPDLDTIYKMDLDKFKNQLAELGGAMIVYAQGAEKVSGGEINDDTDVGGAVTLLHKIADAFREDGGFTIPENMPTDDAITEFGVQIAALAGALAAFEEAGAGLGGGTKNAINALDYFADLKERLLQMEGFGTDLQTSIDAFKGEDGQFIRKDELTTFGEDIAQLGSAMKQFAMSTQLIDEESGEVKPLDFENATKALESIAGLNEKLPTVGGVLSVIRGRKKTLQDLASEIELLGTAMGEFYTSTTKVNEEKGISEPLDFSKAEGFLESIVGMEERLSKIKIGGLPDFFEGHDMGFGDLASQLVQLGSGLNIFSEKINGGVKDEKTGEVSKPFDAKAAEDALSLLKDHMIPFLQGLKEQMGTVGGLKNVFKTLISGRDYSFTDLSGELGKLGEGLGTLGSNLNTGNWSDNTGVQNAFESLESIISMMIKMQDFYTRMKQVGSNGANAFEAFSELREFIGYMSDSTLKNANGTTLIEQISDFMKKVDAELTGWADENDDTLDHLIKRMEAFKLFTEGINALTTSDMNSSWRFIGTKLTTDVATAIAEGTSGVTQAISDMVTATYTSAQAVEGVSWYDLGVSIGTGIESGVKFAGTEYVTPAVAQMMTEAYEAGKQAIDSNSPSKLFAELGEFMGEGTAVGLKDSTKEVGENAGLMGEVALDKARDMIAMISSVMAEDISSNPTITPILDMTNLRAGMNDFRDSLSGYGVNLDTSVSASRVNLTGAAQTTEPYFKPDYTGIYERMEQLGEKIIGMEDNIRKMKLVLDTGVIAGGVSDLVDERIGQKIWLLNRGNSV